MILVSQNSWKMMSMKDKVDELLDIKGVLEPP